MLEVCQVSHSFSDREVLRRIDFSIHTGEFVSIIGPSGCGKSTIFNILTGLLSKDSGEILYHEKIISPYDHPFAYMPQKDTLFPWKTVLDNAILPQLIQGRSKASAIQKALSLVPEFGLEEVTDDLPSMLSGGMRQRVNLLRTYLFDKEILLLDEPFGSLDAITRAHMQNWLIDLWTQKRKTVILVTHDIEEAIFLSDRIIVLTPRPATVSQIYQVELPRPRTREMLTSTTYAELKKELYRELLS